MSEGYTAANIKSVCEKLLSRKRAKPVTGADFLIALADFEKMSEEDQDSLAEWQDKTPLGKALVASFKTDEDDGGDKKKKK